VKTKQFHEQFIRFCKQETAGNRLLSFYAYSGKSSADTFSLSEHIALGQETTTSIENEDGLVAFIIQYVS